MTSEIDRHTASSYLCFCATPYRGAALVDDRLNQLFSKPVLSSRFDVCVITIAASFCL